MSLIRLKHPLADTIITRLRDKSTSPEEMVRELHKLSLLLAFEAMNDLWLAGHKIVTPLGVELTGTKLQHRHALIPIMRAGDGMRPAFQQFLPNARVWHVTMSRNELTAEPEFKASKVPEHVHEDVGRCFVLDPMLATGGSASFVIDILKQAGATDIVFIGAFSAVKGEKLLQEKHPDVALIIADTGDELDERYYLKNGPGDMGDRLNGTT